MRFVKTAESIFDIPSGFTRVEYLETSGSKYYIDTGYKANSTTKVEIKTQGQTWIFGGRTSIAVGDALGICFNANMVALQFGSQSINYNQTGIAQQVSECVISQDGAYINGVLRASFTSETFSCPNNLYLFDINNNGVLNDGLNGKMWYCRIYDNGTLVRDFIPCIDPLGVACMYDLVGKKPYYNQGTGDFTVGRQIIPVEYLEGTGTQYIDTGLDYFADFEIGIQLRANVSNKALGNGSFCCMQRYNTANPYWYFTKGSGVSNSYASSTPITEHHVMKWKDNKIYSDDVLLTEFTKDLNTPNRMCLFGVSSSNKYPNVIYFCKLWNPTNGTLVRDYIPCKDENNVGFMFDTLSGTVYENAGTGAFVVGNNKYNMKLRLIKDNILPTGYTQVEYLESSGTQWIDTGIDVSIANTDICKVITDFTILTPPSSTGINAYTGIFGAGVPRFGTYGIYDKICFGYVSAFDNIQSFNFGQKYNLEYTVTKGSQEAKLDSASIWTASNTGTLANTYKLGLFCRTQSTVQWIQNARIYNFKFYDNGTLICDYIPAIDPSGTPCMYDLVSRTPFYNQGTGTFTTGKPVLPIVRFIKDILPAGYKAVNYLESSGTQYIDTGYSIVTSTDEIVVEYENTSTQTHKWLFGSYETNANIGISSGTLTSPTFWYKGSVNSTKDAQYNSRHILKYDSSGMSNDGTNLKAFTSYSGTWHIYLFALNNTGTSVNGYFGYGKIYSYKHKRNGVLVRNFIPVVRLLDNKAGMWDTVTKQFYGNAGTGDFITG